MALRFFGLTDKSLFHENNEGGVDSQKEVFMKICTFVLSTCFVLLAAHTAISQQMTTVQVPASDAVIAVVGTFNSEIWFFTSAKNPITTLDGLKKDDVACWGAEQIANVFSFLDAAGVKYEDKGMQIIGTGNPIYNGMENPPKLFITWSNYAANLVGAARVIFVKGGAASAPNPGSASSPGTSNVESKTYLSSPKALSDLLAKWNGKYVLYAHNRSGITKLTDLNGKDLLIAVINVDFGTAMNDAMAFLQAAGISMNLTIQNNVDLYGKNLLDDGNAVGIMLPVVGEHYGFGQNTELVKLEFRQ